MEGDLLEDLGVDGGLILRRTDLTVKGREDMAWINQAQDRDKCRTVVNTLCGTAELLSGCVEEICSVERVSCDRPFRFFSDSDFYAAFNRPGNSSYIYLSACALRWQRRV